MPFLDLLSKLIGRFESSCASEIRTCDELWEAVDRVVKLSHPNIHYVPDYRKKLMPAVEYTLKFADDVIVQMPPPIPVDADSWHTNPFIRIVFSDERQFKLFFFENKTLKDFFQRTDLPRCSALLVMNRKDKNIFGTELDGEILKRDVLQTSIDFSDHQIVAPMGSEEELRKELSLRLLSLLATHALEDILSLIEWKKEMETEKQILEMKLSIQKARPCCRKSLFPDRSDTEQTGEASDMIKKLDRKIAEVRTEIDEPEDYLNKVTELLYHPEKFVQSEFVRMSVNDMNILVENSHQGKGDEIRFTEFSTVTGLRKAMVLVDCKRF